MTGGKTGGTSFDYVSSFSGISGTTIVATSAAQFTWAFAATLEAYNVTKKSDYPAGQTSFYKINLKTLGATPSVRWRLVSDPADNIRIIQGVQGAKNAIFTILY